ncbi:MAG: class I SAM-dependent methyltransferase [candidate division KSB1 bacterium]|nr:class I SAM-dependent methyltransferase [candidate division KSB1 bacterium]MDZ7318269.1 class I SAM-dependent methyltransferase [candidate division KSB1 bacterium]MDZ7340139.1 class I SAM-dependent methyltransferase [candidate division KSB1 bacterium]
MGTTHSTREHWEKFWQGRTDIDAVYSTGDRIFDNLRQLTPLARRKVLEVGAGSGRDSFRFAAAGATVYVLDYATRSLAIVQHLNRSSPAVVHAIQADALHIPMPDNSLDIIFHQGLLEHFRDPLPLLQEQYRVLKPGGWLLVDVPQRYHYYTLMKHALIFFNRWFAGWETEFSIHELKKLLERAGFVARHQYGSWMRPSLAYRVIREAAKKIRIKLPLYPRGFEPVAQLRDRMRTKLAQQPWAFYTFLDIGVVGQKQMIEK